LYSSSKLGQSTRDRVDTTWHKYLTINCKELEIHLQTKKARCHAFIFRLLRLLGRRENRKDDDSYKRGEPDGSEEVTALQKTKKRKTTSKKDLLDPDTSTATYADESDIDIFPVTENGTNGEASGCCSPYF
jgi:hypothetical protein